MMSKMDPITKKYVKTGVFAIVLIIILVLASKVNQNKKNVYPPSAIKKLRTMVKQSAQYASLSEQDANPIYSFMHANTALNYFMVVQSFLNDNEIQKITGVYPQEMLNHIQWLQERSLANLSKSCPIVSPSDEMHKNVVSV